MTFLDLKTILHDIFSFNSHLACSENADWVKAKKTADDRRMSGVAQRMAAASAMKAGN
jgi:hypothetical protein